MPLLQFERLMLEAPGEIADSRRDVVAALNDEQRPPEEVLAAVDRYSDVVSFLVSGAIAEQMGKSHGGNITDIGLSSLLQESGSPLGQALSTERTLRDRLADVGEDTEAQSGIKGRFRKAYNSFRLRRAITQEDEGIDPTVSVDLLENLTTAAGHNEIGTPVEVAFVVGALVKNQIERELIPEVTDTQLIPNNVSISLVTAA